MKTFFFRPPFRLPPAAESDAMIRLAAYGRGERAAAAPAQRLSVQGPRRDRRRGGARGRRSLGPPLPGGQSPPEPRRSPAGPEVSPWGRAAGGPGRRCPGRGGCSAGAGSLGCPWSAPPCRVYTAASPGRCSTRDGVGAAGGGSRKTRERWGGGCGKSLKIVADPLVRPARCLNRDALLSCMTLYVF